MAIATAIIIVPDTFADRLGEVRQALLHLGLDLIVQPYASDTLEGLAPTPSLPAPREKLWRNNIHHTLTTRVLLFLINEGYTLFAINHSSGSLYRIRFYQGWVLVGSRSLISGGDTKSRQRRYPEYYFRAFRLPSFITLMSKPFTFIDHEQRTIEITIPNIRVRLDYLLQMRMTERFSSPSLYKVGSENELISRLGWRLTGDT